MANNNYNLISDTFSWTISLMIPSIHDIIAIIAQIDARINCN